MEWRLFMEIIKANNVVYEYIRRDEEGNVEGITRAVNDVSLDIEQGQFIAILGHNGSGKAYERHLKSDRGNALGRWYGHEG